MTSQDDFLKKLAGVLSDSSIPSMVSGSFGSGFHGQPRATRDVDIVIAPTEQQFRDALGVAVVQWGSLDIDYLQKWAQDLLIEDSLKLLLQQAKELSEAE